MSTGHEVFFARLHEPPLAKSEMTAVRADQPAETYMTTACCLHHPSLNDEIVTAVRTSRVVLVHACLPLDITCIEGTQELYPRH